jgi:YfiH family protein
VNIRKYLFIGFAMSFNFHDAIKYYTFSNFGKGVRHGIFTRIGGVSPSPWNSLNLGGTVGDDVEHVRQNRQLVFDALGLDILTLFDVWQVHGTDVVLADKFRPLDEPHQKADIILTDKPNVTLVMRFADCTPIFLYDPVRNVIGLAHAGWKGTVKGVAKVAVEAMVDRFGCVSADIKAGIGPSIGPDHYEVGDDVVLEVEKAFGTDNLVLKQNEKGKYHFDLWEGNRLLLNDCGVKDIEISGLCTACNLEDWYSHRAEKGKTGRFGALLCLEAPDGR